MAFDYRLHDAAKAVVDHVASCLTDASGACSFTFRAPVVAEPTIWPNCDAIIAWLDPPVAPNDPCCGAAWTVTTHLVITTHCAAHPFLAQKADARSMSDLAWRHARDVANVSRCLSCDTEPSFWRPAFDGTINPGAWPLPTSRGVGTCWVPTISARPTRERLDRDGKHVSWTTEWTWQSTWNPECGCWPNDDPEPQRPLC